MKVGDLVQYRDDENDLGIILRIGPDVGRTPQELRKWRLGTPTNHDVFDDSAEIYWVKDRAIDIQRDLDWLQVLNESR